MKPKPRVPFASAALLAVSASLVTIASSFKIKSKDTLMSSGNITDAAALDPAPSPITIEVKVRLQAIALPEADGDYSIVVPALPACVSEADTLDDVQAQVTDAAEGWLSVAHDRAKDEEIRIMRGG